jgi:O-antigen/teichoic acid export membrane protein
VPTLKRASVPENGSRSLASTVGSTAAAKVMVMGVSGLLGLFTSRMIIQHFGTNAYAQYGLLTTFPALLPFADLGMAAIIINAVAGSESVPTDRYVRNAITTAMRILIVAGAIIVAIAGGITALGLWPTLLGQGLTPGGSLAAFACLALFGLVLPLTVGPRIMVGLRKTSAQVASQAVVAPFILASVTLAIAVRAPVGNYLAVLSYLANALVAIICLVMAARAIKPQLGRAFQEIPRLRQVPSLAAFNLAWPMLVQMVALPVAMQTDRLLLSHLTRGDELAQYNLASQLFGMVLQAIMAGGLALWPIYARARAAAHVRSPFKPTLWFMLGGLLLAGVLALVSPLIAGYVSGGRISLDLWLVLGFVVFVVMQATKYPLGMYMTDKRGLQFQVLPILIMVPLNLGVSWWLIGVVGPGGPIIGSAVSVLACQVIPNFAYVSRDLKHRSQDSLPDPADLMAVEDSERDIP